LPPFVVEMPDEEQKEVKTIWRNYKKGDDCGELREQTKAVLDRLPSETRDRIFHHGPSFLRGASDDVRRQFKEVWKNSSLNHEEKLSAVRELAEKLLNKKQLAEFKRIDAERERAKEEFAAKVSKLSPAAKEAYDKLEELKKEKAKIYESLSPEVRIEINRLFAKKPKDNKKKRGV
uniref:DUF148 domain-containing protein n=1 Tax=Anisakis simplex TaxID=6269 RepID=A0A0M3IZ51_ANISI